MKESRFYCAGISYEKVSCAPTCHGLAVDTYHDVRLDLCNHEVDIPILGKARFHCCWDLPGLSHRLSTPTIHE